LGTRLHADLSYDAVSLHGRPFTQPEYQLYKKASKSRSSREALFENGPHSRHFGGAYDIFDAWYGPRTSMAQALNELSYYRTCISALGRIDYAVSDVRKLREEIHEAIVPLAARLVAEQEQH